MPEQQIPQKRNPAAVVRRDALQCGTASVHEIVCADKLEQTLEDPLTVSFLKQLHCQGFIFLPCDIFGAGECRVMPVSESKAGITCTRRSVLGVLPHLLKQFHEIIDLWNREAVWGLPAEGNVYRAPIVLSSSAWVTSLLVR